MRKLNRPTGHRMSMLRTMVSQLVKHERIETTLQVTGSFLNLVRAFYILNFQAKEIRSLADNMVQLGKEAEKANYTDMHWRIKAKDPRLKICTDKLCNWKSMLKHWGETNWTDDGSYTPSPPSISKASLPSL